MSAGPSDARRSGSEPGGDPLLVTVNPLRRWCSLLWLNLRKPLLKRRSQATVLERVCGVPLLVLPKVLNPVIFRGGRFLGEALETLPLPGVPETGPSAQGGDQAGRMPAALDLGTGSGVGAVFAARRGFRVTAADLNPEAVLNARINVLLNGLEERVEVLQSDLFQAVQGRRFDLILFNPPFFSGEPRNEDFDLAWRSQDLPRRLAGETALYLRPEGCLLLLLSTDGDQRMWLDPLTEAGFQARVAGRRHLGSEIMTIFRLRKSS